MPTPQQEVFIRIVVHNKLLTEGAAKAALEHASDPEQALRQLVSDGALPLKTAKQVLAIYRKKLSSLSSKSGGAAKKRSAGQPKPGDSHTRLDDALHALMDEGPPPALTSSPPTDDEAAATATQPARSDQAAAVEDDGELRLAPPAERAADETAGSAESPPADAPERNEPKSTRPKPQEPVSQSASSAERGAPRLDTSRGGHELIHAILTIAREAEASDVHIKSGARPVMRLASRLEEFDCEPISPSVCEHALLTLTTDQQRKTFQETNDLDFCYDGGELGRFRTNFFRQHRGTDGIFRLIPAKVPAVEELGLPPAVKKLTEFRQGMVLLTGPKGCGKTTTMAALVDLINSERPEHIITIEDPIEFVHPCKQGHVNQREVGRDTMSFSNALRASLREAPDVIVVGEMRDLETTSLAITAAETGHLVFATLHTSDATRTIGRILDVFPAEQQGQIRSMLSESLRGIVSQLLIPTVDGRSQALALELLVNTSAIAHMIRDERTYQLRGMIQTGKKQGMILLDDSLVRLVENEKITAEDALSRASDVAYVQKELGMFQEAAAAGVH